MTQSGALAAEYVISGTPAASPCGLSCYGMVDTLGSTRMLTNNGLIKGLSDYFPFGEEVPSGTNGRGALYGGTDPRLKFTGKERDAETGLDYFGARYFSGAQGRWTSPDRMNVTDDRLVSPSSTLNKYVYAANNPLRFIDPDGRDVVALLVPPHGIRPGHFMLFANNPANGQSAMMSFGPTDSSAGGQALTVIGAPMSSTDSFNLPKTVDELRNTFAALSIQTTPEQAQDVINFINQFSPTENFYRLYNTNCTTVCRDALKAIGLLPRNYGSITPFALWGDLFKRYANPSWTTFRTTTHGGREFQTLPSSSAPGFDYGNPRFGMNTFDFMMLWLKTPDVHSTFKPCSQDDKGCGGN